jgi:signal transduction histidine kinase
MIYGKDFYSVTENNRENLMKIVMSQTENLKFLENSRHEANILLDVNYKVIYFNKLAEIKFCELYSHTLQLNEDFTDYLDPVSKDNFFTYFQQSLQGKTIQAEEKFMLHNESNFTWLQISFIAHYAENGKLIGVSIGATAIDAKRKMEQLQAKYLQSLDELAWNSSHILRAPVANMMGILQLLQETNIALDDTERAQFLKHLSSEVKRVDTVIKDMVAKARKGLEN